MRRIALAASLFAALLYSSVATAAESKLKHCAAGAWTNAFEPQQKVNPQPTDVCPADLAKPLYTREGALACVTDRALQQAVESMRDNWRYVPVPGGVNLPDLKPGMPVTAETFGCRIYHDGTPVTLTDKGYGTAQTDIGRVPKEDLRN
jgi:hypothetical protein